MLPARLRSRERRWEEQNLWSRDLRLGEGEQCSIYNTDIGQLGQNLELSLSHSPVRPFCPSETFSSFSDVGTESQQKTSEVGSSIALGRE